MNEFEKKLQEQKFRAIPAEWREQILSVAPENRPQRSTFIEKLHTQLTALLWPNPKAWAAMAAIWVVIIAMNVATNRAAPQQLASTKQSDPAAYVRTLREEQQILAQLLEAPAAEPPKADRPRPRSEYVRPIAMA